MKTTLLKYISILGLLLFLIACSTKKNTFLSRNSHALSTEYNILYNGGLALDKGIVDLKTQYKDNFWERLPIERMQISNEAAASKPATKNPNFDRAETKAIKAIQKHSMNIAGSEKNPQMDEAHLMLGKARYYDQRFVPALEAFNYILYKYPNSDKIYEAKIWREKTNIRMDNDALAVNNLRKLLNEIKFKDQIFADANAILSQAFLNLEQKDSAIAKLKLAKEFTKQNEEKARYHFILGQLYEELGYKDSAFAAYQSVIDMKRKAARQYVIQAHAKQAQQFDFGKGDTVVFLKKFKRLLKDRENRPFLDVLNHQMALFYDKGQKYTLARKYYNESLKSKSQDQYLVASNYRNLADIYFNKAKYLTAGKYYDSTLVQLNARSREFKAIKKKRENLVDVIKYEGIATRNDSIIKVYSFSESDKISYYEDYISKLKKEAAARKLREEKAAKNEANQKMDASLGGDDKMDVEINKGRANVNETLESTKTVVQAPSEFKSTAEGTFYFYNPTTVAYGKNVFRKNWGDRSLKDNWRLSAEKSVTEADKETAVSGETAPEKAKKEPVDERYTTDFYINQLPKSQTEMDSIAKERNFAYYQLGVIYKEKFKEYQLAAGKLEQLLVNKPEERLVLPSMYNLYKIYEIIDRDKASVMKTRIINLYPDSRYAQILSNANPENSVLADTPEVSYDKLYKLYITGDYKTVLKDVVTAIDQFAAEEIVPKFELLKANTLGKLKGLAEFKKALNYVALTYPNSEEGKRAEALLLKDIPKLERLKFYEAKPSSWKILYQSDSPDDKNTKKIQEKINKFIADRGIDKLQMSYDIYTMDKNFIVIHGIKNIEYARGIVSILKEYKDFKIQDAAYVISNDNYKIVQIKKNFEEYLSTNPSAPVPVVSEAPVTPSAPVSSPKTGPVPIKASTEKEKSNTEILSESDPIPEQKSTEGLAPAQDLPTIKKEKR